jgi:hypothetical protein
VLVTYLRSKIPIGTNSLAERVLEIGVLQLQKAINQTQSGLSVPDCITQDFLSLIDTVCKSVGHTNNAAKSVRLKMLSDAVQFGTSAVFLTNTPNDSYWLLIQINVQHKTDHPPNALLANDQ